MADFRIRTRLGQHQSGEPCHIRQQESHHWLPGQGQDNMQNPFSYWDPYFSLARREDSDSLVSQLTSSKRKSQGFFPGGWLLGLPGSCVLTQGGKDMACLLLPPRALHHEHCSIPGHPGWLGHLLFSDRQKWSRNVCLSDTAVNLLDTYCYINVP